MRYEMQCSDMAIGSVCMHTDICEADLRDAINSGTSTRNLCAVHLSEAVASGWHRVDHDPEVWKRIISMIPLTCQWGRQIKWLTRYDT